MSVFSRLWGDDPLLESSTHGHSLFKSCGAAGDTARQAAAEAHDELMELRANPRFFSPRELLRYDGSDPSHPLLLAIKGIVLDVSTGVDFYGPGERYNVFAGCDASRAFALSMNASIDWENLHADMSGLTSEQLVVLDEWASKLHAKYPNVGELVCDEADRGRVWKVRRSPDPEVELEGEWRIVGV